MHKFMRAIGFSEPMKMGQIHEMIRHVVESPSYRAYTSESPQNDTLMGEFRLDVINHDLTGVYSGVGISVCGEFSETEEFLYEYYLPCNHAAWTSTSEEVNVDRRMENTSFAGAVDDLKVGVTVIFRIINPVEYLKNSAGEDVVKNVPVSLSALSVEGTVMMPISKSEKEVAMQKRASSKRMQWMTEARNGDENAMRNLTLDDMDNYAILWNQIRTEDVYSLVDSYFAPSGMECDLYAVMGEIESCMELTNRYTGEQIYRMKINCNELVFDLCINKSDLYGEPAPGRRFKGEVWMQGELLYTDK